MKGATSAGGEEVGLTVISKRVIMRSEISEDLALTSNSASFALRRIA